MSLKRLRTGFSIAGIICISVGLFCGARYMGWLEQDSSPLGNLARFVYGPDVRREMNRLKIVKENPAPEARGNIMKKTDGMMLCYDPGDDGRINLVGHLT